MTDSTPHDEPASSQHLSRFLHQLREQTLGRAGGEAAGEPPASSPPDTGGAPHHIGRYETLGEIARGGMGIIFKVQDAEMRRTLAMKVLMGEIFQPDGSLAAEGSVRTSRFLEEAQVTGQLEHPGIIPVHEMGLDDSGRLFFTMRLVKGKTLDEVIRLHHEGEQYWTRMRVLGVMMKVCEAMAFAHEKRVIHRDLKPANVMVGRFGETYVMDWGLAKVMGEESSPDTKGAEQDAGASMLSLLSSARTDSTEGEGDSTHSTMEGDVLGTPAYMPPEQAHGRLDEMGPSSDVYSVGAMLYHLLSGSAPYTTGPTRPGPLQILQSAMEGPPEPLEKVARSVPPELIAICERAMEREAERRYPTMLELADDLHAFMEQRVVKAYEAGSLAEFRKWVARNKGMAVSAAAALVFALSGLAAIGYVQSRGKVELTKKNHELARTNEELARTNNALDEATEKARANEKRALEQEAEALSQSYRANVSAAAILLDSGSSGEARNRLASCAESQRGWEWSFLDKVVDSSLREIEAHEEFTMNVSFNPDGDLLISLGGGPLARDASIKLWDVESGEMLNRIVPHGNQTILGASFTPSGAEFVTSGVDGTTVLWDTESGEELLRCSTSGAFLCHPDGRRIVIGSVEGPRLTVWDIYEDSTRSFIMDAGGTVNRIRFVDDEDLAVVATSSFEAVLVDLRSGETLHVFDILRGRPEPPPAPELGNGILGLDVDGRRGLLLTGASDGSLVLWNLKTGEIEQLFDGHRGGVRSAHFHPRGPWIVSSELQSPVRFWHENGKPLEELYGHENWCMGIDLSPDGDRIASCSLDGTIHLWDGHPGSNVRTFFGDGDRTARFLDFSPEGDRLAWMTTPSRILIGDTRTGERELALPLFDQGVLGLAFGPGGDHVLVGDGGGRITVWNARTGMLERASGSLGPTSAIGFSEDGSRIALATATVPATITLLDGGTLEPLASWTMPEETRATNQRVQLVLQLLFTNDGERLLVNSGLEWLSLLRAETGELESNFTHPGGFGDIAFDEERNEVATLGSYAARFLRFHDASTGELIREYGGHGLLTCFAGYSPDRKRIAVGASDGSISLWDPDFGELTTLSGIGSTGTGQGELSKVIAGTTFSPDGSAIATLDWSGTCRIWDRSPLQQHQTPRQAANRRRSHARRATKLVDRLFEKHILVADVVAALTAEDLEDSLLGAATRIARLRGDDSERLNRSAREIVMDDSRRPVDYVRALAAAEAAVAIRGSDAYRVTLGAARYRMGEDEESGRILEALAGSELHPWDATVRDLVRALVALEKDEPLRARQLFREAESLIRTAEQEAPDERVLAHHRELVEEVRARIEG